MSAIATTDGYEQEAKLFQAFSHPVRLRILDILARQEACVCHLGTLLERPQPYVSQQLAALREAGLVTDRRDGTLVYYRLADNGIVVLLEQGKMLAQAESGETLAFPPVPEKLSDCPCPRCQS